jgi:hypothetical protein
MALWMRSRSPPWCSIVSNDVINLTTIVAGAGTMPISYGGGCNTVDGGAIALGMMF